MKFYTTACVLLLAGRSSAVLLPSQDPFYTPPTNVSSYLPGAVIKSRQVAANLNNIADSNSTSEMVKAVYQYLYRTTDSLGNPVAAVTTLLVPYNADAKKLLAYQQAYDSANNDCSPSYAIQSGANTTATADIIMIVAALDKGWYVITPDYEGLSAEYSSGLISGYATLDSVRAALNEASTSGLSKSAKYAMWGYSGGSIASEWAAELQPSYAKELQFQGVALGGLIPNATSVVATIHNTSFSGLLFSAIYGLAKAFPNMTTFLETELLASKKAQFYAIAGGCVSQALSAANGSDLYTYFKDGAATFNKPIPQSVIAATGLMGLHGVPRMPVYVYKAVRDEISPVADTDELVAHLCSEGATISYYKDIIGEHISEAITGAANAIGWLDSRLDGQSVSPGCSTQYVAFSPLGSGTLAAFGDIAYALLQNLLGGDVGLAISG